jgi:ribosomal protein S18 acetylase RimI-like enzyme
MGIRLAEPGDHATVRKIVDAAYEPWAEAIGVRPLPLETDYAELIADRRVHVLENGAVDALIVLRPIDGVLVVENLAVRPDRQGRGLGRRLMAFAEFRARSLRLPALRLYTNEKMVSNIGLYESLGYRETGREEVEGRRVVHMLKEL